MKILLLAILSIIGISSGIAALMIFGNISPALPPSHDWNSNSGTLIDTPGLGNMYQVGDTAKFSILIRGFTNHRCTTPAIMLYADNLPETPVLNYSSSPMSCPINDTSSHTLYLPSKSDNFSATFENPGPYTLDILFGKNESIQTHFLVTGSKITHYYDGSTIKPKVELYDYHYTGIDKDNAIVSINNQTYYQTTLNYTDYDLKKRTSILFQNVTFAFPEGVMDTPGGAFIMLDIKFLNGSEEIYGENEKNPDGSGALGGIGVPTQYGPHLSTNSTTILGNHVMPQAGITIYNDKIKLLVSADNKTHKNNAMVNKILGSIPSCVTTISHQYAIAGPPGGPICPYANFVASDKILNATGFYGIYNYTSYPGTLNYVLEPGHNGTIMFLIHLNMVHHNASTIPYSNKINITNDVMFMHDAGMQNHPGVNVLVEPQSQMIGDDGSSLVTVTFSASKNALPGIYWVTLPPGFCVGGQTIILTVTDCEK